MAQEAELVCLASMERKVLQWLASGMTLLPHPRAQNGGRPGDETLCLQVSSSLDRDFSTFGCLCVAPTHLEKA